MNELYAYSLVPVLSVALLLFFSSWLWAEGARGLTAYCLAVAVWSSSLLMAFFPLTAPLGQRLVATGGFVAAAYLHLAFEFTDQRRYALVWLAYGVATVITLLHMIWPGLLYDPVALTSGPLFWPTMGLAIVAATIPLWQLLKAYQSADPARRWLLIALFFAGLLSYVGAWITAILLSHGIVRPYGNLIVLASLFILANVVRSQQGPVARRLLERSLLYSTMAAFLTAGFLFGMLWLMGSAFDPRLLEYRLVAFFVLCMAAVAFEPLRQHLQELAGRALFPDRTGAPELARELATVEERLIRAERLTQIGTFTSAVAHEVRNPLGVIAAHMRLLEQQGVAEEQTRTIREQIGRAERFVEDLLRYGRPPRLEPRELDLAALTEVAFTTARDGLSDSAPALALERPHWPDGVRIEADYAQILDLLVILFENALLALRQTPKPQLRCSLEVQGAELVMLIEDNGPGVPQALASRLFEPFVTGRKREGKRVGTGLGLAIAAGVVARHGGSIEALLPPAAEDRLAASMPPGVSRAPAAPMDSAQAPRLAGAAFRLRLPRQQRLLGLAAEAG